MSLEGLRNYNNLLIVQIINQLIIILKQLKKEEAIKYIKILKKISE